MAASFHCEVEDLQDEGKRKITVKCHGRLVSSTTQQFKDVVKPLIASCENCRILLDFGSLEYMDSSGLGTIVGLKVSTLNKGSQCSLELLNLTPRVRELLSLANLTQLFSVKAYPGSGSALASHAEALSTHGTKGQND
jgi:anti-anti-sigma factor